MVYVRLRGARCNGCGSKSISVRRPYLPDFFCGRHLGDIVEAKGKFTGANRAKYLAFVEQNPDVSYRIIFMSDNTLGGGSKTRYSDWCKANGITFHVSREGRIPDEWVKELKGAGSRIPRS